MMDWWRDHNQEMMDRTRDVRMDRIFHSREHSASHHEKEVSQEAGGKKMIKVTRLSGEEIYLNVLQIESMSCIPETKIKMMNGYYIIVKDTAESVIEQIRQFAHSCIACDVQEEG